MREPPQNPLPTTPETKPVLIVGAGPTGLTAAMELVRLGVLVRLVDKKTGPSTTSRALAVQARTLELLQQRGLAAEMLHLGNQGHAVSIYDDKKQLAQVQLRAIPSRYNFILLLSQADTERLLREQVARQGTPLEWRTELAGVAQAEDGVRAILRHADGTLEEVEAAYLISAEGAHSSMRHTLNLAFPGKALGLHYALADLYLDGDLPDDELSIFLGEKNFLAVFPMKNRHFRFIATGPGYPAPAAVGDPTLAELQHLYDATACLPARLRDMTWSSRFSINSRMVDSLQEGRIFLGGDAAHIHSPAGGQGMNTGIQDMINLCWKLALVWHGQAPPDLLATYAQDRLPIIREVVSKTEKATDLFNSTSPVVHQLLTHALPVLLGISYVQHLGAGILSETTAHYRESDLSQTQHAPGELHGGDRVPDLLVQSQASPTQLYNLLNPSRFTLLVTGTAPASPLPTDWEQQLRPWRELVAVQHLAAAPEAAELFAQAFGHQPGLLLVRPDSYLALAVGADGWPTLLAWLQRWLPGPKIENPAAA